MKQGFRGELRITCVRRLFSVCLASIFRERYFQPYTWHSENLLMLSCFSIIIALLSLCLHWLPRKSIFGGHSASRDVWKCCFEGCLDFSWCVWNIEAINYVRRRRLHRKVRQNRQLASLPQTDTRPIGAQPKTRKFSSKLNWTLFNRAARSPCGRREKFRC